MTTRTERKTTLTLSADEVRVLLLAMGNASENEVFRSSDDRIADRVWNRLLLARGRTLTPNDD